MSFKQKKLPSVWTRMPNTAFAIGMGLAGQSILWNKASRANFLPEDVDCELLNMIFWFAGVIVTGILFLAYLFKAATQFYLVRDEFQDEIRVHFFNMPHLILTMLGMSVPSPYRRTVRAQRIVFLVGLIFQTMISTKVYMQWFFGSPTFNFTRAKPPFLLSTVGWLILACLGAVTDLEAAWGIPLPSFCYGIGIMMYFIIMNSILLHLHQYPQLCGSSPMFLLLAPPSVAVVSMDTIINETGNLNLFSECLFGWCIIIFLLLVAMGPKITPPPPSLGAYWAYVFPMAAFAAAAIRVAWEEDTRETEIAAQMVVTLSCLTFLVVVIRMGLFIWSVVVTGKGEWKDGLYVKSIEKRQNMLLSIPRHYQQQQQHQHEHKEEEIEIPQEELPLKQALMPLPSTPVVEITPPPLPPTLPPTESTPNESGELA